MSYLYKTESEIMDERLETKQLVLRPYQPGDEIDFMHLLLDNKLVLPPAFGTRLALIRSLEDARITVEQLRADWDNRKVFEFGVWQKEEFNYIGSIALRNMDYKIPKAEMGLYFADWPTNKEHARQAIETILAFAFNKLLLNKVYIRFIKLNTYMEDIILSCGFVKEGTLRNDYKGTGSDELHDLSYYGMTRKDFEKKQSQKKLHRAAAVV